MLTPQRVGPYAAVVAALGAAVYVVRLRLEQGLFPSTDLYGYFLPNTLYAVASAQSGGHGLLWNPFQNCGQPFLSIPMTGLFYPPYWLFLVLDVQHALTGVEMLHLIIGGLGAYWLARELGAGVTAGLAAALTFEMGNTMLGLVNWSPMPCSPYAWIPAALACCERLLREPCPRRGVLLAAVLTLAILVGHPQTVFFTYQVIALRFVWELVTRRQAPKRAVLGALLLGVALPFLLSAVQLLPAAETAADSLRGRALKGLELQPFGRGQPGAMSMAILLRSLGQPFMLIPCMLVGPALCVPSTRKHAFFYTGVGLVYVALSLGPGTPLFDLYVKLPMGSTFRDPPRFFWVTGFCMAVVTGLGCAALASARQTGRGARLAALLLMALPPGLLVLLAHAARSLPSQVRGPLDLLASSSPLSWLLPPGAPAAWEWVGVAAALMAGMLAGCRGRAQMAAPAGAMAALSAQLLGAPALSPLYHFPELPPLFASEAVFGTMRSSLTPQDRVYLLHDPAANTDFAFMAKTASLLRVPSVLDYEPLASQRYTDFSMMLRSGKPSVSITLRGPDILPGFKRRLFDLAAIRFLVVPMARTEWVERLEPHLDLSFTAHGLNVYENRHRFPRAFYVPRVEVVTDPETLLEHLANGPVDLHQVALVEEPPASGFTGAGAVSGPATVDFVRNDPEHLVLRVQAPERGFLVLGDQHAPGWFATLNDRPAPILRANYAFRLVEVPAGESSVVFRYAPRRLWLGAIVSAATLMVTVVILIRSRPAQAPLSPPRSTGGE